MKKEEGGNDNTLQQNNRKVELLNEGGKNEMWGGMRVAEPKMANRHISIEVWGLELR